MIRYQCPRFRVVSSDHDMCAHYRSVGSLQCARCKEKLVVIDDGMPEEKASEFTPPPGKARSKRKAGYGTDFAKHRKPGGRGGRRTAARNEDGQILCSRCHVNVANEINYMCPECKYKYERNRLLEKKALAKAKALFADRKNELNREEKNAK